MRTVTAVAFVLLALQASAQDQRIVSVWEDYEYETSDRAYCGELLSSYLAEADFWSPLCDYQDIDSLLGDGWLVDRSVRIEAPVESARGMIDGCYLIELKCVGTRYYMTRDEAYQPPAPPVPQLKHIRVPEALGKEPAGASAAPD